MLWTAPFLALGLLLLQWGLGRMVLRWPLGDDSWLERHLLQGAVGFAFTTVLLFCCALTGWYRPGLLVPLFWLLLVLVLWREGRSLGTWCAGGLLRLSDEHWTPLERAAMPALLLFLGLCAFYALAPTTTWDPLDYHYELPRRWLANGHFFQQPGIVYHQFPSSTELHFGWLMALHSDLAANQYTILTILTFLLAAAAIGIRYCSRQAAVVGLLGVAALPLVYTEQAQGGVIDCALGTFMLLALWLVLRWRDSRELRYFLMLGLCAGMAVGIKHSGWMIAFFLFGFLVLDALQRREALGRGLERAIGLGLMVFSFGLPWYLKSYTEMGNPVWPFADHLFNGTPKHFADILYWSNPNFTREPWDLVTWWWDVTTRVDLTQYRFRLITPFFLGLLPAAWYVLRDPGPHRPLLAFCAFQIGALLFQAPGEPRYMMPAWALLGMLLLYGAELGGWTRLRFGSLALGLMALGPMAWTLAHLQMESRDRLPFIMGQDTRWESFARRVETAQAIAYIEAHLQPGERVLHGDPRVYLYRDPTVVDIVYPMDHPGVPSFSREPRRILKQWHERKVRFVTLSAGAHYMGLTRATLLEAQKAYPAGPSGHLGIRSAFDGQPPMLFRQESEGTWELVGPLPESPLGPLSPRVMELGGFTTAELVAVSNPRVTTPPADQPNYFLTVKPLQQRWSDIDVRIILTWQSLIRDGALVKVLDNPACPVWEVRYPESWGPPGTNLREHRPG